MRRLDTVSALTIVGALSALLTGCPVWGGDDMGPRPDVRTVDASDSGPVDAPRSCSTNDQCHSDEYCDTASRVCVPATPCSPANGCASGMYCDNRNVCVPGCGADSDCSTLGQGLVCDTTNHRCIPGGGCTADSQCTGGDLCVGGECRAPSTVCQFDNQCAGGTHCVDGRCVAECTTRPDGGVVGCAAGQLCVQGYCANPSGSCDNVTCASNQVCSGGTCVGTCTGDAQCGSGNFCDNGVCHVDDRRPAPFCTATTGCSTGSVCVEGVCHIACPSGTTDECQRRDVNFNRCDTTTAPTTPYCRYSNEVAPQCARNADCSGGKICVNALCVTPG